MKIDTAVLRVLSNATINGDSVMLHVELDRKLYVAVNKVLELAGGKWNRKAQAHLFESDPQEVLDQVLLTGEITQPQNFDYFPTPERVVGMLFARLQPRADDEALEPSAGTGNIARRLCGRVARLDCVELQPKFVASLREQLPAGASVTEGDFLKIPPQPKYSKIAMNPPFKLQADIRHVMHATDFLRPGGRLSTVMSAGVTFRQNRLTAQFHHFLQEHGGQIEDLPDESFRESGTLVRTVLVSLQKRAA